MRRRCCEVSVPTEAAARKPNRWFDLTPNRFLAALLAAEGVLLLSERFHWFAFNHHKGWTVLIAVAGVGVAILFLLLWFVVSLFFRWRFQFGIAWLLVLVIVVAAPCSWLAVEIQRAKNQKEAVKRIEKLYGPGVPVGYAVGNPGGLPGEKPIGPTWLRNIVGDHFFAQVFVVHLECSLVTDAELHRLKSLDEPSFLDLRNTQVTDAGMESLKGLTQLQELALEDTRVTEEGVRKLRQALPNCEITWEPPTKDERQSRASLDQTGG